MNSIWLKLYALAAAAVFTAIIFEIPNLYLLSKPLLMMMLLLHFYVGSKTMTSWRVPVLLALVFSWGGDVLLMFDGVARL